MAVERVDDGVPEQGGTGKALRRRGILAAAGAALAGIVAKQVSDPVRATSGTGGQGALVLASNTTDNTANTATRPTYLFNTAAGTPNVGSFFFGDAFVAASVSGLGVKGQSGSGTGVQGLSDSFHGVIGQTGASSSHAGVAGFGAGTGTFGILGDGGGNGAVGVQGQNGQYGVYGTSSLAGGCGVRGDCTGGIGVLGASTNSNGVQGQSTNSIGVFGASNGTGQVAGVYGVSNTAYGVIGNSTAPGFSGLTAITGTAGVAALAATSTVPNAFAAFFTGSTVVQGNLAVTGSKSAAVPHPDGSHRLLYCVEAPEAWFEDFGKATLAGGKADVALDPDFAALVDTAEYHVFLTEHGGHNGLHTTRKGTSGFVVEADGGLAAVKGQRASEVGGTFSWRVVAKRKGNPGGRLAKFAMPTINHPDPDNLPKAEAEPPILPTKR